MNEAEMRYYLVIDAEFHGTGIRDYYNGGYLDPKDLHLSAATIEWLNKWQARYENEHYSGYENDKVIDELDRDGKEIALTIKKELQDSKIQYYSDARMTIEII